MIFEILEFIGNNHRQAYVKAEDFEDILNYLLARFPIIFNGFWQKTGENNLIFESQKFEYRYEINAPSNQTLLFNALNLEEFLVSPFILEAKFKQFPTLDVPQAVATEAR